MLQSTFNIYNQETKDVESQTSTLPPLLQPSSPISLPAPYQTTCCGLPSPLPPFPVDQTDLLQPSLPQLQQAFSENSGQASQGGREANCRSFPPLLHITPPPSPLPSSVADFLCGLSTLSAPITRGVSRSLGGTPCFSPSCEAPQPSSLSPFLSALNT